MQKLVLGMLVMALMSGAWADLLNDAAVQAVEAARTSLMQVPKPEGVQRIGVAKLANDPSNVTDLLKAALTKAAYDVVLTDNADWPPLWKEFERQMLADDMMVEKTAQDLHVQGVDAVLYGTVEKSAVAKVKEDGKEGERATVQILLKLANLSKEDPGPGGLIWSEQVTGTAEDLKPIPTAWEDGFLAFVRAYRIPLGAVAVLVVLFVLWRVYKRAVTPR